MKSKKINKEIKGLFSRISREIFTVVQSYYIWKTLVFARSIPKVGKEQADENVKLINVYKFFFLPTEQSHLNNFIIGLMKFFDKNDRSLSFFNIIKKLNKNEENISQETLNNFERVFKDNEDLISNLKKIRNKQLAHTDMKVIEKKFIPKEVEELIKSVQDIFNSLTKEFDSSTTIFFHIKEQSISVTNLMLKDLKKGREQTLRDIRKKWDLK